MAIAIVATVADQPFRERREEAVVERGVDEADFRGRSAGHVDGERKTMAVATPAQTLQREVRASCCAALDLASGDADGHPASNEGSPLLP
jgi:hypothetical protein